MTQLQFITKSPRQNRAHRQTWPIIGLLLVTLSILAGCQSMGGNDSGSRTNAAQIDREVDAALAKLYETTPAAKLLASKAKGILVFPNVVKAGFIGGAEYGKGAMRKKSRTSGYYNIFAGSYGLQAGVQSFGYAMFFMNDAALASLDSSNGLEIGVGPNIVVLDEGMAKKVTSTTLRDDVYAFVFGQRGLMAGLGLQGSKITRINP
ncbi:MAG: lipid-binding SYLF domain-containing protein [Methylicorpusculum sp.]|uniref:lipid-binding SYLF domain-containing protein n=1 Tax=Methylicorpusculum sp. TaxID=2713644 RepID=UPI0027276B92|nr:lipid-binding SYLF domain-containing protein [Methylicorpusculum sp.]MDO8843661.1 lipid-binding SYLF domain-containing protein [Methylicorpusculum sp.]MDO8939103.1 lipid-binding SYLF domain-containing protein [Methylicorpusculum sp.]MDO9239557.1 lipid-binding SYLF domain-containing protein [Methylicorpusculum sp.]MDP2179965.1 lipid-binding SYLF domain-containing protein [Methylicorpusculum sp.]MDP2200698.1 lipid-binding SYLF domain-containing protein [Methylicorpusculum sp.]